MLYNKQRLHVLFIQSPRFVAKKKRVFTGHHGPDPRVGSGRVSRTLLKSRGLASRGLAVGSDLNVFKISRVSGRVRRCCSISNGSYRVTVTRGPTRFVKNPGKKIALENSSRAGTCGFPWRCCLCEIYLFDTARRVQTPSDRGLERRGSDAYIYATVEVHWLFFAF